MTKRILIVDDEFGLAEVVAAMLAESGHDADVALNGEAALARMAERPPDLVLLDVVMPLLDGPDVLRRMRAEAALAGIPVILMTSLPHLIPADIESIHQGVLIKPFKPAALLALVDQLLGMG
jgi:DNA-binding response OmpR family regulator